MALPLLDDYDYTTTLFLFLSIHIQGFRKELNEERKTRRPIPIFLLIYFPSYQTRPRIFFFLLVHEYSPYDLIKLEPEVSICIMNFLFFFLCKIYITYILLPYARTIPITLHFSLTHTLLTQPFVFVFSDRCFPRFSLSLLICLFYFPVFFLEIYCINNLAVVCFF